MNPIPFDLQRAKAGEPIQCRDGTPAKFIAHAPQLTGGSVLFSIDGGLYNVKEDGRSSPSVDYRTDLFMAPVKEKRWLNIYHDGVCHVHDTRRPADIGAKDSSRRRIACIEIEYTEGQGL